MLHFFWVSTADWNVMHTVLNLRGVDACSILFWRYCIITLNKCESREIHKRIRVFHRHNEIGIWVTLDFYIRRRVEISSIVFLIMMLIWSYCNLDLQDSSSRVGVMVGSNIVRCMCIIINNNPNDVDTNKIQCSTLWTFFYFPLFERLRQLLRPTRTCRHWSGPTVIRISVASFLFFYLAFIVHQSIQVDHLSNQVAEKLKTKIDAILMDHGTSISHFFGCESQVY